MNIQTLKKWKENGLLEAALDSKLQVKLFEVWQNINNEKYELNPSYHYRIKPEFECGDIVKTKLGDIYTVLCVFDKHLHLLGNSITFKAEIDSVVKVKRILKPHTFETAVKDCAENGFETREGFKITTLKTSFFYVNEGYREYSDPYLYFPNDKPFCQVEYEECT